MRTRLGLLRASQVVACAVGLCAWTAAAAAQVGAIANTAPTFAGCGQGEGPPPPDQADCVAHEAEAAPDLSWAPRAVLAVPRLAFRTTTEVLMLGARLEDDYHLSRHAEELFFNDARTFGVYPWLFYGSGVGTAAGAQLVHKDLFGRREGLRVRGGYGGPYRQLYDARLHAGERFERVRPSLLVGYMLDDGERFYGLGNGDDVPLSELALPLDAQEPGPAVHTQFRVEQAHGDVAADVSFARELRARALHVWRVRHISSGPADQFDAPWVDEVFAPSSLVGFGSSMVDAYSEVALTWDTRRAVRADLPRSVPGGGLRTQVWTGVQAGVSEPYATFGRAGFDVQPFIDLYRGDRILHLRVRGASAIGPLDEIPFLDLPSLGGSQLLRGYNGNRFRGRVTLLASVEYRYPVQESMAAYVFTDAGRVWPGWEDVSFESLRDLRVGFGVGMQIYSARAALLRGQIATSIDGGVFLHLKVNTSDDFGSTY